MSVLLHSVRKLSFSRALQVVRAFSTTSVSAARQRYRPKPKSFGLKSHPFSNDFLQILNDYAAPAADTDTSSPWSDEEGFGLRPKVLALKQEAKKDLERRMVDSASEGERDAGRMRGETPAREGRKSKPGRMLMSYRERVALEESVTVKSQEDQQREDDVLRKMAEVEGFDNAEASTIYVSGLPHDTTQERLYEWLGTYGEVEGLEIAEPPSVGYTRIRFKSPSVAKHATFNLIRFPDSPDLVVRSCMYGGHEKPIYLGKHGSILHVAHIPRNVTQQELRSCFHDIGLVEYVHIPRHKLGHSFRYAWVHFFGEGDAAAVARAAFHSPIYLRGRRLHVYVQRDHLKQHPRVQSRSLFMLGLPNTVSKDDIAQLFKGLADLTAVNILPQKDEEKRGDRSYNNAKAFVDFPATQDARKVLDMHHLLPFQFDGRELLMNFCDTSQPQGRKAEPNSTLYVAGLPVGATVEDVAQAFKSYEHVFQSARLLTDSKTGEVQRTCFVQLRSLEAAKQVLKDHFLNPIQMGDNVLQLLYARSEDDSIPCRDLCVTKFEGGVEGVTAFFADYAKHIERINVTDYERQRPTGIAWVRFDDITWAMRAKDRLSKILMPNGARPIIRYSTSRRSWVNPLNSMRLAPTGKQRSRSITAAKAIEEPSASPEPLASVPPPPEPETTPVTSDQPKRRRSKSNRRSKSPHEAELIRLPDADAAPSFSLQSDQLLDNIAQKEKLFGLTIGHAASGKSRSIPRARAQPATPQVQRPEPVVQDELKKNEVEGQ